MKVKLFSAFIIAALLVALSAPGLALAGAYESTWASTIAYQNIGTGTATVNIAFYTDKDDTTPDTYPAGTLAKDASDILVVGTLIGGTFKGTAVLSADQPLTAVILQTAGDATIRVRPLSNGFTAGTVQTVIPSVFKLTTAGTQFSVQNVGPGAATVEIKYQNADGSEQTSYSREIQAGAGYFVDAKSEAVLPATWQGAVVLTRTGGTGLLVSSALELNTNAAKYPYKANAFEGVGVPATTLYMPTAQCDTGVVGRLANSSFEIFNPNAGESTVTITFTWQDNSVTTKSVTINGYGKKTVGGCEFDTGVRPTGLVGSGKIVSTNSVSLMAVGKLFNPNFQTAFNGIPEGFLKVSLPFVRWADTTHYNTGNYQRTFISIQNISGFDLAADKVKVHYIGGDGLTKATESLGDMINLRLRTSSPLSAGLSVFGYDPVTYASTGGGVVIECLVTNCKLAVVTRIQTYVSSTAIAAEDYVGLPIIP